METTELSHMAIVAARVLLICIGAVLAVRLVSGAMRKFERALVMRGQAMGEAVGENLRRSETIAGLTRQALVITLWTVTALIILQQIGVQIGPILAGAGVVGLAIGFGAQNLVRDVIAGFFIILENQVCVGDVAIVNGTSGVVESVGFRTMILRDVSGAVHVFPNGSVTTLANLTRGWSGYVFDVTVPYSQSVDRVMDILREVGVELRNDLKFGPLLLEDMELFGVDAFHESGVVIKGRLKTKPGKQWDVGREYRRRVRNASERAGIEIAPQSRSLVMNVEPTEATYAAVASLKTSRPE